jgi:hypothetical protein
MPKEYFHSFFLIEQQIIPKRTMDFFDELALPKGQKLPFTHHTSLLVKDNR